MSSKLGAVFCGLLAFVCAYIAVVCLGSGEGGYLKLLGLFGAGGAFGFGFYALLLVPRRE